MNKCRESSLISGRPFGGTVIMLKNELQKFTCTLYSSERCVVVKVYGYLLVNVYLPCAGTVDRSLIIEEVLTDISIYLVDYPNCTCLIGGDFNCDFDGDSQAAAILNKCFVDHNLVRCDNLFTCQKVNTYVNTALDCSSCIDYFLTSNSSNIVKFEVIDEGSNLSDHLPISVDCLCNCIISEPDPRSNKNNSQSHQTYLRWDRADLNSYYMLTGQHLQSLLNDFIMFDNRFVIEDNTTRSQVTAFIDSVYESIVHILCNAAAVFVPVRSKQFYKFWWDQELDCLKEDSISVHKLWKAAGKPRAGPLFQNFRHTKLLYKRRIRECQRQETSSYTNDLHEALVNKEGNDFWKCWRSKFEVKNKRVGQVDGLTDEMEIVKQFEKYFTKTCSNLTVEGASRLSDMYNSVPPTYCGFRSW